MKNHQKKTDLWAREREREKKMVSANLTAITSKSHEGPSNIAYKKSTKFFIEMVSN